MNTPPIAEKIASGTALGYLTNALLGVVGAPHIHLEDFNAAAETSFLVIGGIFSTGWAFYKMMNERSKFRNSKRPPHETPQA